MTNSWKQIESLEGQSWRTAQAIAHAVTITAIWYHDELTENTPFDYDDFMQARYNEYSEKLPHVSAISYCEFCYEVNNAFELMYSACILH